MSILVTLKDQVHARPAEPSVIFKWQSGVSMRLSDLIRERVRIEMDRRENERRFAGRPLVEIIESTAESSSGDAARPRPTLERAVATAFEGFRSNAYFVTIDDRQITDLDAEIAITPATDITFIRLLPLVGG
jgi:hypothetical protein